LFIFGFLSLSVSNPFAASRRQLFGSPLYAGSGKEPYMLISP
jgi:hypothetical protein